MNLQQFLSEEPIDKLFQQFFSIEGQSQKSKSQESVLINSIVLYIASNNTFNFKNLYEQCQYQLEVNNQQRDAVNKMCRLLCGVIGKAPYLLKNIEVKFFVDDVLQFLLSKVFVTVCSADCIRCIWALVNAFTAAFPLSSQQSTAKKGCCSQIQKSSSSCCGGLSSEMKDENTQNNSCCKGNSSQKQSTSCCSAPPTKTITSQPQQSTSSLISKHEQVCKSIVSKLLNTFKLHVKAYPFKVRKDIYKLIYYVLRFTKFSQQHFLRSFSQHQRYEMEHFQGVESQPLFVQIGITKQQLIQTTIKNLSDQKDPRNMQLIFQNYIILISLFAQQISTFNYRQQLFENIEVYYPLSMQGDQSGFQIDSQDNFSEFDLKLLLDQCLLQDIFCNQVRQLLVEKMSAPPINDYVSLYVNYITKFNPMLWKSKLINMKLHQQKYIVLTVNLLQRLCEEEYLDESYTVQQTSGGGGCCSDDKNDSCCGGNKAKSQSVEFSISQLIATIIKNVFISAIQKNTYSIYSFDIQQRFVQFLNALIVTKLFNTVENHKHAGTIIDIVKTVLNSEVIGKNIAQIKSTKAQKKTAKQSCCSSDNNDNGGCCSTNQNEKSSSCQTPCQQPSSNQTSLKQSYGKRVNFEEMLTNFVILKFMQYWSAKGDIAFKLGLLIISLNKKLESVSIQQFSSSVIDESTQNLLEHLLITLGNVYEAHLQTDQVKIMVLKTLMIVAGIYNKLYQKDSTKRQKSIIKVTKVNNGLIHKDCIKLSEFLNKKQTNNQQNKSLFDRSQQPILKSYVDYIMEMYVTAQKQHISEETLQIIKNIFQSLISKSIVDGKSLNFNQQAHFDVKLYGLVRYLSIVGFQKLQQTQESKHLSHTFISILLFSNKQINTKITDLLKYYNYSTIFSLIGHVFSQIESHNLKSNQIDDDLMESFFINLSLIGKVLKDKFVEFHVVELESGTSNIELISSDIDGLKQNKNSSKLLVWYLLKNLWRGNLSNPDHQEKVFVQKLNNLIQNLNNIEEQTIVSKITKSATSRLTAFINLYSNSTKLQSITSSSAYSDLQSNLLYIKYLKSKNQQQTIRFDARLGQLYDPGMVEYFWNRLFKSMTYEEKSLISLENKTELVALLEYLPEKILVNYAGQVAPLVIYTTQKGNDKMQDQKDFKPSTQNDQFDFSMSKLITKLCPTLPQQSLIAYVIPYCLSYLKIAAISCQNGTQIPQNIAPLSQTINVYLSISKILAILIQKGEQKSSQKGFKFENLRKSLLQQHKKQFRQYFGKLIYHKKRLIRQSSRFLLSSFE